MPRKTQNAVFGTDGQRLKLGKDAQSYVTFLDAFNALNMVQATDASGAPLFIGADGKPTTDNTGKPFVKASPRSGYIQYWNNDGFTDPESPSNLKPQGVGKLLAKLFEVANTIIASGGDNAKEMTEILEGALAYNAAAPAMIAQANSQKAITQALEALTKANNGDAAAAQQKLADYLASQGNPNLANTVVAVQDALANPVPVEPAATETEAKTETQEIATVVA